MNNADAAKHASNSPATN